MLNRYHALAVNRQKTPLRKREYDSSRLVLVNIVKRTVLNTISSPQRKENIVYMVIGSAHTCPKMASRMTFSRRFLRIFRQN